ncbi:hypothetical protein Pla110_00600 [Polystyrenella longa]|uniref:Tetratricopeptide repeat protein n=1 Tax=Polystyrenella longa TaxID=2528007 RepID=A0A518CGK5_9PLAN|nr:hypothetical protein [Polystyrenella longa]QDU78359.1 hypothetical protein Pla110_00600 [Polystyrenella longa]
MNRQLVRILPGLIAFAGLLCASLLCEPSLMAQEQTLRFLDGLREREYYDTALFYLEQEQQRPNLDPKLAARLQYEQAALLLESASQIRNPDSRQQRLNEAAEALAAFVKEHPDHPQIGSANRELAKVHLNNARVALWEADSTDDAQEQRELRQKTRREIELAREIFRKALPQLTAEYAKFPPHVDPDDNETEYREKKQLEQSIINSRLELAKCTYEEAQSYPEGSAEFRERLTRAIDEFELLHFEYRNQTGGHYARLWQGKCYEELNELTKALGIYTQILSQPQSSSAVERLQDLAEEFRLICLNHSDQAGYEQVIQEANYWISNARKRRYSAAGLGILWQRAVAYEKLALTQPEGSSRRNNFRQALNDAEEVQRFPGRHKGLAMQLARRLSQQIRGEENAPEDFASALDRAQQLMNQLQDIKADRDEAAGGDSEKQTETKQIYEDHLARTDTALQVADDLRDNQAKPKQLAQLFYYRAYIDYLNESSYSAAVRAEYVAHQFAAIDSEMAQRAALLSTASFAQALNNSTEQGRAANIRMMEQAAQYALSVWPNSDMAANCCQLMGQALTGQKQFQQAADWYSRTPPDSNRAPHNRVLAGQSMWQAFLQSRKGNAGPPPSEEEQEQLTAAEAALQEGVQLLEKFSSSPPLEMITGKATLAEIYSRQNQDARTIELLTAEPAPVTGAIEDVLTGESNLPLSSTFSASVYRLLLKAYVGTRDIDQALQTMQRVEELSQQNAKSSTMGIYVQLGKELERELNELEAAGEQQQTAEMRQNFKQFLEGLYERQEGQSFSSLFWVAETYNSLASSLDDTSSTEAVDYFERARSAYQTILQRDEENPDFITDEQKTGIDLRLASALGDLQQFDAALASLQEVVQANPNSLVAQYEAASLLQAKGMSPEAGAKEALSQAIQGTDLYWGWNNIGRRLQQMKTTGNLTEDLQEQYYESRLNSVLCRQRLAELSNEPAEKQKLLASAEQEIVTFFSISGSIPDEWYHQFNDQYSQVRSAQQKTAESIAERLQLADAPGMENAASGNIVPGDRASTSLEQTEKKSSFSPELLIGIVVGLGALLFLVILFFGTRKGSRKRKRRDYKASSQETPTLSNGSSSPKASRPRADRTTSSRTSTTSRPKQRRNRTEP